MRSHTWLLEKDENECVGEEERKLCIFHEKIIAPTLEEECCCGLKHCVNEGLSACGNGYVSVAVHLRP